MKKLIILFIAVAGFGVSSFAQNGATTSALSSATIVTPIAIVKATDMEFGTAAVSGGTAGTVVLPPTGSRTKTGGITLPASTGSPLAASFNVTGALNYTYAITLPSSVIITNTTGVGAETMTVDTFTSTPTVLAGGTLNGSGAQTLYVGATLNVSGTQVAGRYVSGTGFNVTVNYN